MKNQEQLVITKKEGGSYEVKLFNLTPKKLAKMIGWFICDYISKRD